MTMQQDQKVWSKSDVLELLDTNSAAVARAVLALNQRQTEDERASLATKHSNGRGFNANDAAFLGDIARKLPRYNNHMTPRQLAVARKKLRKYWRQLLEIIEEKGGVVSYSGTPAARPQGRPAEPVLLKSEPVLVGAQHPLHGRF